MRIRQSLILTVFSVVVVAGFATACGGKKYVTVTIPPRLDLTRYERAALAMFTVENAKGSLHELATRRFAEQVLAASQDVEILEIGNTEPILQQVGEPVFGSDAARSVGSSHDVPVVFAGHMKVTNAKPSGGLGSFGSECERKGRPAVRLGRSAVVLGEGSERGVRAARGSARGGRHPGSLSHLRAPVARLPAGQPTAGQRSPHLSFSRSSSK